MHVITSKSIKRGIAMFRSGGSSESRLARPPAADRNGMGRNRAVKAAGLAASMALLTFSSSTFCASSANYTYDALGRLTRVTYSDGAKTSTITYSYDAAGNRTSAVSTSPS
jgi:hypothetical protein